MSRSLEYSFIMTFHVFSSDVIGPSGERIVEIRLDDASANLAQLEGRHERRPELGLCRRIDPRAAQIFDGAGDDVAQAGSFARDARTDPQRELAVDRSPAAEIAIKLVKRLKYVTAVAVGGVVITKGRTDRSTRSSHSPATSFALLADLSNGSRAAHSAYSGTSRKAPLRAAS